MKETVCRSTIEDLALVASKKIDFTQTDKD